MSCLICGGQTDLLHDAIADWEYGVDWAASLRECADCGLVCQDPPVNPTQVPGLYPDNYLAHSPASGGSSIYGRVKESLARRTASKIAAIVPPGGCLMEIGCGNGHLLRRVSTLRPDINLIGVDIEDAGIDGLDKFSFHHGQFESATIAAQSVDLIYCSNLIEHVPDPMLFSRRALEALRPGGTLLGVTPDHLSLDRYLFGRYWAGYHYPRHTFVFNHHNIADLLRQQGFSNIAVKGAYSFWYLSFANRFQELPGTRKRGLLFAAVTAAFLPLDLAINLFRPHGSLTFRAQRPVTDAPNPAR